MALLVILLTIVILTASIVYVLLQDARAPANRLFALFTASSLLLSSAGAVRFASREPFEIWFMSGLLFVLLAVIHGLLIWLIMLLFIPHRYQQPAIRWATFAPYAIMAVALAIDWYGGVGLAGRDIARAESGTLEFVRGPLFWPAFGLYLGGCVLVPLIILMTIAARHQSARGPTLWLTGGAVATFLMGYVFREIGVSVLVYASLLPLHLSFGWVTLRYGIFRPSQVALEAAVERLPDGVLVLDAERRVRFANQAGQRLLPARGGAELSFEQALHQRGFHEQTTGDDRAQGARRFCRGEEQIVLATEVAIVDERGAASVVVLRDVTLAERQQAALRASQAALAERTAALEHSLEEIRQRDALITRLTLPLIPLTETALVAPLIGAFDQARCQALVDLVLRQVGERNARTLLIDLTGLTVFDQTLARALRQLNDGARLMGASMALCGVRPDVAEVMIQTGNAWHEVRHFATLQEGVATLLAAAERWQGDGRRMRH